MAKISARKLILCELLRLYFKRKNNNIKKKRFWVRQIFMERHSKGEFHVFVKELKLFDHEFFFKQFRMTPEKLENLLTMVAPRIMRNSLRREAIGLKERLLSLYITLLLVIQEVRLRLVTELAQ